MQNIEPFWGWRELYCAEEDNKSIFFEKSYSEFEYTESIYNYYIHPQWDSIESETLFVKIIYVDYENKFAFIELMGEWNDAITNDIEILTSNLIDFIIKEGVNKIILIGENVLNFHSGEIDYYSDLKDKLEGGWITLIGFHGHVIREMNDHEILDYVFVAPNIEKWRTMQPETVFKIIKQNLI